jgi:hypothetical protein
VRAWVFLLVRADRVQGRVAVADLDEHLRERRFVGAAFALDRTLALRPKPKREQRCLSGAPKNLRSQICEATRHDFWLTAWEVCGALYTERHDDAIAYSIAETLALSFGAPRAPPIEDVLGRGARAETTDVISGEPEFARWGTFDDDTLPTLQAIAEELNLTRERVRQIEAMAIQRLRLKFWQQGDRETRARLETRFGKEIFRRSERTAPGGATIAVASGGQRQRGHG